MVDTRYGSVILKIYLGKLDLILVKKFPNNVSLDIVGEFYNNILFTF